MSRYMLTLIALFLLSYFNSVSAEDVNDRDPACIVPSERIERHMMRFARASEDWSNARARAAVSSAEPVALTDKSDHRICETLWDEAGHLLAKQKRIEGGEFFRFDAGFYRFGPFYVVAVFENTVDPDREDVHPLETIQFGAETGFALFNGNLEFLGNYDYRGNSLDREPKLILKR